MLYGLVRVYNGNIRTKTLTVLRGVANNLFLVNCPIVAFTLSCTSYRKMPIIAQSISRALNTCGNIFWNRCRRTGYQTAQRVGF